MMKILDWQMTFMNFFFNLFFCFCKSVRHVKKKNSWQGHYYCLWVFLLGLAWFNFLLLFSIGLDPLSIFHFITRAGSIRGSQSFILFSFVDIFIWNIF